MNFLVRLLFAASVAGCALMIFDFAIRETVGFGANQNMNRLVAIIAFSAAAIIAWMSVLKFNNYLVVIGHPKDLTSTRVGRFGSIGFILYCVLALLFMTNDNEFAFLTFGPLLAVSMLIIARWAMFGDKT